MDYTDLKTRLNYARRLYKATGIDGEHGAQMMTEALAAIEELEARVKAAYLAGFHASAEDWNGEHPFDDRYSKPDDDAEWCATRDKDLAELETPNDRA